MNYPITIIVLLVIVAEFSHLKHVSVTEISRGSSEVAWFL